MTFREAGSSGERLRNGLETAVRRREGRQRNTPVRGAAGQSQTAVVRARRELDNTGEFADIGTGFRRTQGRGKGARRVGDWVRLGGDRALRGKRLVVRNDRGTLGPRPRRGWSWQSLRLMVAMKP